MKKEFIIGTSEEGILVGTVSSKSRYFSFSVDVYNIVDIENDIENRAVNNMIDFLNENIDYSMIDFLDHYFMNVKDIATTTVDNMTREEQLDFVLPDIDYSVSEFMIDDKEYMVELVSCGQIDFKDYNQLVEKNKELNDFVYELWKDYHLMNNENLPTEKILKLEQLIENVPDYEDEMENYILENLEMLDKMYIIN